jgi:hypothetical protein
MPVSQIPSAGLTTPISITTLNAPSGVLATQNGMTGIAKAWVNFNGVGGAIRSSFNVSSITVNGTGDYTVNFTTAMPNANYAVTGAARFDGSAAPTALRYLGIINANGATLSSDMSTTFVRVNVGYDNGFLQDPSVACVVIFSS